MTPCIEYTPWKPRATTYEIVERAVSIVEEYAEAGYDMTVRQIYYQFVVRGFFANTLANYNKLSRIIDRARLAGWIDWNTIVDRTRKLHKLADWDGPVDIVSQMSRHYRSDRWARQPNRFEVWVEKEALAGVFRRVCDELQVPLFPCRGYPSQSAMWRAARRVEEGQLSITQDVIILHFGDHDPSGIDMTRDIRERHDLFSHGAFGILRIERMALNMDQVEQYDCPPNPAKETDPRGKDYRREFGETSWEVDALDPAVLSDLVRDRVLAGRDQGLWDAASEEDEEARRRLRLISDRFDDVVKFLRNGAR